MADSLVTVALRRSLAHVRHVTPVRPATADPEVDRVYRQVERDFGMLAPPVALHSPAPDVLAASWVLLRETMLATGAVDRRTREAVATAVSSANSCPYCVAVHGATLRGLVGRPLGVDVLDDSALRHAVAWATATATPGSATAHEPAGPADRAAELIGVVATFQYLNRMVTVFLGESPLPPQVPNVAHGPLMRVLGGLMRPSASRPHPPGASLELLPTASVAEPPWAAGSPNVGAAVARTTSAIEGAAARVLSSNVRNLVDRTVTAWRGGTMGISAAWAGETAACLSTGEQPVARLALLTALAPHQVSDSTVTDFRSVHPRDVDLISVTAWASLTAALRVASWIPVETKVS